MEISITRIKELIDTLPIGYYIKRSGISVKLDKFSLTSYYVPKEDSIHLAIRQIKKAIDSYGTPENYESLIRSLFYHEVSHAFMTPKGLDSTDIYNIFEDERIESVLKNYYLNVDFKKNLLILNDYKSMDEVIKTEITTTRQAFYSLVRFRIGKPDLLERVHEIITRFSKLSRSATCDEINRYEFEIKKLYDDLNKDYHDYNEDYHYEGKESNSMSSPGKDSTLESLEDTDENTESGKENSKSKLSYDEKSEESIDPEKIISVVSKELVPTYYNKEMIDKVNQLLSLKKSTENRNSGAINSYSGVFDVRSVTREDYKYFLQKNRLGHHKSFSKIHFNLFIDKSGSFWRSENIINQLLYSLVEFENTNEDFSFDLITCGMGEEVQPKDKRVLHAFGGNKLDDQIFKIFRDQQIFGYLNYNIVLFDGDAFTDGGYPRNFGAFNSNNTIIISDPSNQKYIGSYCKSSKVVITRDYADKLIEEVFKNLEIILR